ncbi:MAG TPA: hypothetical protein VFH91_01145 [Pyrinomonadaceae bacterium]|nr:hypothetical protein [Pyrinomonadaceae bacterium]
MPQELFQINSQKTLIRVLMLVLLLVALFWSLFAIRWYLGNTLAEYFNPSENSIDVAQFASSLAPNDPLPHWRLGQVYQQKLPVDQIGQTIAEYQKAISLSPNDYRFWLALGTAQEQAGDVADGEIALRRAVALAPAYSFPHWYLGNLLLRSSRYDEAFTELRIASEADNELRPQLFNFVSAVYGRDLESIKRALGNDGAVRVQFCLYLINQKSFDDGLAMWSSIDADSKQANRSTGDEIVKALIGASRFHNAVTVYNDLAPTDAYRTEIGKVLDGGFEESMAHGANSVFGWRVGAVSQMQLGIDPAKSHSGRRSLRLLFQVKTKLQDINVSQQIAVLPNTEYDFECFVSTEKLESGSTPLIEIVDASDQTVLGTSSPVATGTNDWSRIAFTFKTKPKSEGVIIRVVRSPCEGDVPLCPIFGVMWYDDFSFKKRS